MSEGSNDVMIEWAALSKVVLPAVMRLVAERAQKLGGDFAGDQLSTIYKKVMGEDLLSKVNQTFVSRFREELDRAADLPTLTMKSYLAGLKTFLSNGPVQDVLQAPLDGESELDWQLLRSIWGEIRTKDGGKLITLPDEFDWPSLARMYKRGIRKQMLVNPELRPVTSALMQIRLAEATERTATAIERLAGATEALDIKRYAQNIKTAFRHLRLGSVDSDWTHYEGSVRLEQVYIPQSVKATLPPREHTRDYLKNKRDRTDANLVSDAQRQYAEAVSRNLAEVVDDPAHRRMVILGDPGLGKSTFLKHLALRWAESPSGPLTLFVELRHASRQSGQSRPFDCLGSTSNQSDCLPPKALHDYLLKNDSMILLDGLDEIPQGQRRNAVAGILELSQMYKRARILLTTRIQGYFPGSVFPEQFRDGGFSQFALQDFSDSEIARFVEAWHQEAFQDPAERERYQGRLATAISDSPAIRELAANPLMLTMMAILSRTQDLPRDRSKLYERCAELLLKNWDLDKFPERKERTSSRDIKDKLGSDQKMRILELVAAEMQKARTGLAGNLIPEDSLKQVIESELTKLGVREPWSVADDLIWMFRERNFMISHLGDHQYAFVHRTFLEYFCARDLRYRLEKTFDLTINGLRQIFRERLFRDEWKEILRLLSGMIGPVYAEQCISELIASELPPKEHASAVFFAAECLQEIREIGLVRNLRDKLRGMLLELAKKCEQDYQLAFRLLSSGWRDDVDTIEALKNHILNGPNLETKREMIAALSQFWKGDPYVRDILSQIAVVHERGLIRYKAIKEIARGWRTDPVALALLESRAVVDPDPDVRFTAKQCYLVAVGER
jgi:NACHT domain/HEAT repeats